MFLGLMQFTYVHVCNRALADNMHQLFTIPPTNDFWNREKNAKTKSHYVDSRLHSTDYKSRCRNISRNSSM